MAKKRPVKRLSLTSDIPADLTLQLVQRIEALRPSVKTDYLKAEILSKYVSPDTVAPEIRRNHAIMKWLATERENEATNERLLNTHEEYNILPRVAFGQFVEWCRNLIVEIIDEVPSDEALIGRFSGGASTSRSRTRSHPATKYLGKAHATPRCLELFLSIADEMPGWLGDGNDLSFEVVPGNVLFTVPKKTDIDRCACKEPDLNMFIQKGIGRFLGTRLKRTGINLRDQSINRRLAHEGSVTGKLATLDLSSASDSVSEGLVALLLPVNWYTLLDTVRCQVTVIDGEEHQNQMFSSMGNGFTFELESLLFYVLARATAYFTATPGVVSVYGDDIICSADMFHDLTTVLNYFGFSVNTKKSFSTGPFRESCGGHYHNGIDITPFYIKAPITTLPDLIHVANSLRKWAHIEGLSILNPEVREIWLWLKAMVPSCLWGGVDLAFKYQLVSNDEPSKVLVEENRKKYTGKGGYFHWLNATWDREVATDGVATSSKTDGTGIYSLKRTRKSTVDSLQALFLEEI